MIMGRVVTLNRRDSKIKSKIDITIIKKTESNSISLR